MSAAAFPVLVFRQTLAGYEATPEGAVTEFHALITRQGGGGWYVHLSVFGRTLEAATRPTLNEARDYARRVYETVETGAR